MRGDEYLKKGEQFSLVYNRGSFFKDRLLSMRSMPNGLGFSRYGLIVNRRVGKAVTRNRIKRLLREILRQTPLKPGWDIVFFSGPLTAGADYGKIKDATLSLLLKARLILENYETVHSRAN
ncbi:MAG: ribonuclease P protein component [Dehalococcoidia bacterium]|nr:MAG: ribonuclease P protein component [Dehalococcoidia bacterium]